MSSALMGVSFGGWTQCIGPRVGVPLYAGGQRWFASAGRPDAQRVFGWPGVQFRWLPRRLVWVTYMLRRHAKVSLYVRAS